MSDTSRPKKKPKSEYAALPTTAQPLAIGSLYWCETSRSNLGDRFSDKTRRPVLVIAVRGDYVAVYPCSSYRGDVGNSEWIGPLLSDVDTHLIYGMGLFYAPTGDLELTGTPWTDWDIWRSTHRKIIEADLRAFERQHQERIATPVARRGRQPADAFSTSLSARLGQAQQERLAKLAVPPPPPPVPEHPAAAPATPPRPAPRRLTPQEEFQRALDALLPYHVLKPEEEEEPAPSPRRPRKPK